jgi:hypothetical protein
MSQFKDTFQRQTLTGDPIAVGEVTITPESQALTLRWPRGGWVWNRPTAILVERDGETERVPIVDVTRQARWVMLGISALFSSIIVVQFLIQSARKKRLAPDPVCTKKER